LGPFGVVGRVGEFDYRLKLPAGLKVHDVFHVDRLSTWKENEVNGQEPKAPPPMEVDAEKEYKVDQILDSRFYRRQLQYLVRWEGYSWGHDSWEPAKNLVHADKAIKKFHKKNPKYTSKYRLGMGDRPVSRHWTDHCGQWILGGGNVVKQT
jgi:hypothetical protein